MRQCQCCNSRARSSANPLSRSMLLWAGGVGVVRHCLFFCQGPKLVMPDRVAAASLASRQFSAGLVPRTRNRPGRPSQAHNLKLSPALGSLQVLPSLRAFLRRCSKSPPRAPVRPALRPSQPRSGGTHFDHLSPLDRPPLFVSTDALYTAWLLETRQYSPRCSSLFGRL